MSETADLSDEDVKRSLIKLFHQHQGSFQCLHPKIQQQLIMGYRVELEHSKRVDPRLDVTDGSPIATTRIALVHLKEGVDYYDRLKKMETEMEVHWEDPSNEEEKGILQRSLEQAILILSK
jgi:hypothetical protein